MHTFEQGREAVRRDLDAMLAMLDDLPEQRWSAPTRCADWTVADLIAHTADVADMQATAFERIGSTDTPELSGLQGGPSDVLRKALHAGRDRLVAALDAVTPERHDELVPLLFATLPASIAVIVAIIEYGFHRNDLEWAIGDRRPVPADVAATTLESLPVFLPSLPTEPADRPLAYALAAPSATTAVVFRDGAWTVADPEGTPCCTIRGDDSAVALFALGRIGGDDPSLEIEGETGAAADFKRYFPGP